MSNYLYIKIVFGQKRIRFPISTHEMQIMISYIDHWKYYMFFFATAC